MSRRRATLWLVVAAIVTLVAYSPAWSAPFVFDDVASIVHNPSIARLWPPSVPLDPPHDSPVSGRPVSNYTFAVNAFLDRALAPDDTPPSTLSFHLVNLLLHLLAGCLVVAIVRRTLDRMRLGAAADHRVLALAIGAVWLLHPIQTEAVNYLTQRTELVASLCYLIVLWCSIRAADVAGRRAEAAWLAGGVVACLLGMGAKEMMVTAPVMIVLYDLAFGVTEWTEIRSLETRRRRWFYAALAATWIPLALLVAGSNRVASSAGNGVRVGVVDYAASQGWAIARYLRLLVAPAGLTFDYGYRPIAPGAALAGCAVTVFVIIALIAVAWRRRQRWIWFAAAWFLVILAPSSSVVPISSEIAAERRVYLASAAILALVIAGLWTVITRRRAATSATATRAFGGAIAVIALVLAWLTWRRSELYAHPVGLWRATVAARPDNARAWNNLGATLADLVPPDTSGADNAFERAVAADPDYVPAISNRSRSEIDHGQFADAEAGLRHALAIDSLDGESNALLGALRLAQHDPAGALPYLERVSAAPPDIRALINLGVAYGELGRTDREIDIFRRVVAIDPTRSDVQHALAKLVAH